MITGNVSGYKPQPTDYSRDSEVKEAQRRQVDPGQPSPEQKRAESVASQPRKADAAQPSPEQQRAESVANRQSQPVQKLGSRIDVYA